jgi:hypothetical protein
MAKKSFTIRHQWHTSVQPSRNDMKKSIPASAFGGSFLF